MPPIISFKLHESILKCSEYAWRRSELSAETGTNGSPITEISANSGSNGYPSTLQKHFKTSSSVSPRLTAGEGINSDTYSFPSIATDIALPQAIFKETDIFFSFLSESSRSFSRTSVVINILSPFISLVWEFTKNPPLVTPPKTAPHSSRPPLSTLNASPCTQCIVLWHTYLPFTTSTLPQNSPKCPCTDRDINDLSCPKASPFV